MKCLADYLARMFRNGNGTILAITVLLGMAMCCSIVQAQSGAGSIQGTVTDSSGAVIPGVSIHVVNQATAVVTDTKSNRVGFYQVPDLFAGTYSVTITTSGMKTYITSIQLLVAQDAVINASLTPGSVTQQVVVSGTSVQLTTTDNGSITSVLDNARINQLPMNGRSLFTLAQEVAPGLGDGGQSADGNDVESLEFLIDGVTTTQLLNGGESNDSLIMIDPDSVQEVSMQMSNAGAQYGTPATGVITTKSGTNSLHGAFFETARNNGWGIAKSRQDASNFAAPMYIRNEFGASAGGPIILPHVYHGKDKSFWFFAYERYSLATDSAVEAKVPTMAMRQGDFSGLINSSGILQTLYDPSTTANSSSCAATGGTADPYCRTPFLNNQIPSQEESPTAKIAYELIPPPTSAANPLVEDNYNVTDHDIDTMAQVNFRLDHVFNENNRAYLRYSQILNGTNTGNGDGEVGIRNLAADGIPAGAASGYDAGAVVSFLPSIGYTHIFSPTFFVQTIVSQQWWTSRLVTGTALNTDYESLLGLPNNFGRPEFPYLGSGLIATLPGSQNPDEMAQIITMINEDFTKTLGRHQMQFGGRYRHIREMDLPELASDSIDVDNLPTAVYNTSSGTEYEALPNTGYADPSFFIGSASAYNLELPNPYTHYHILEYDGYFQDNYRARRNLTVNLGVRYEARPAEWYKYGLMSGFDFKNDALVLASRSPATLIAEGYTTQAVVTNDENIGVKFETPEEAGMPASILKNYDLIFLPRVGFAYQLFGGRTGTVIRAGYGKYDYDRPFAFGSNQTMRNPPLTALYTQSYTAANQAINGLPDELLMYNDPVQFGEMGVNTANVVNTTTTTSILPGITSVTLPTDWSQPFITNMNFTIEQSLKGNSAIRLSYIWSHATNLDIIDDYNHHPSTYQWEMATGTVPPTGTVIGSNQYAATATGPYDQTTWGNSNQRESTGWSNYNVLEVNYQRFFHRGIAYQIAYDYGRDIGVGGDQTASVYPDANYPGVLGTVGTMTSPYGTLYPGVAPPARPANSPAWADYHAMDYYQGYTGGPVMNAKFNGIIDLPFGKGKRFLGNANRFVNELVGGFQLAGDGTVENQIFGPGQGNWGQPNPLHVYKHHPITDCSSGVCYKAMMWFNGYLAPTVTTGVSGSTCTSNCISGLPADYVPLQPPIDNTPGTTYYGTNDVVVTLSNGKQVTEGFDAGPQASSYLARSYASGPNNWSFDASLFKVFPITEKVNLRFNLDAFNAANIQGLNGPNSNGEIEEEPGVGVASSYNTPRQIQLTLRLTF